MATATFRIAEPADAGWLAELLTRTFRETYSEAHYGDCRAADVEAYIGAHFGVACQAAELADLEMRTIVAEVDGVPAGCVQLRMRSPTPVRDGARPVEIARFYVDRPWHGAGIAQSLMRAAMREAGDADPLWLGVFERNRRARAFYAKCGFVLAGRATFTLGEDVQEDWILIHDRERP